MLYGVSVSCLQHAPPCTVRAMRGDAHPRRTHARAGWRGWRGAGDPDADAIEAKEEERENIDLRQEKQKDRHSGPLLLSTSRDLETYSDHPEPRAAGPISLSPLHLRRSRGGAGEEAEERRRCCDRVGEREREEGGRGATGGMVVLQGTRLSCQMYR